MSDPEFTELIKAMTPETWRNMRQAVATGYWADGSSLSAAQRSLCLRAIIAWEARNGVPPEQRTGPPRVHGMTAPGHQDAGAEEAEQPIHLTSRSEMPDA